VSLKTGDPEQAKIAAYRMLVQIDGKVTSGRPLREHNFEKVANGWREHLKADSLVKGPSGRPLVNQSAVKRYGIILDRYLLPFFRTRSIIQITHQDCRDYIQWRKRYYRDGPGRDQDLITFKRGGKEMSRPAKKTMRPAFSTLHKDAVVFNHVIRHAIERMRVVIPNPPNLRFEKTDEDRDTRRPRFSSDEMRRLLVELGSRAVRRQKQNYQVYYYRNLLRFLVRFLHETGLRPSEVMWLQRKHLTGRGYGLRVAVARDNPGLKQIMHARNVIPTSGLAATILELFIFYAHEGVPSLQTEWPDGVGSPMNARFHHFPQDFWLWSHPDGTRIESMDHSFANALKDLGMEKHEGKRRSLYSLRHTYASEQIEMGATKNGVGLLCSNLGTSEAMLRKHYGQALFELMADDLQISQMPDRRR